MTAPALLKSFTPQRGLFTQRSGRVAAHSRSIHSALLLSLCLSSCSGANEDDLEWRERLPSVTIELDETTSTVSSWTAIRINEVSARNEPYDWVELINLGDQPLDLAGGFLSDDLSVPMKSMLTPEMKLIIAPRGFLVIRITDETLGFKLGKADSLLLTNPEGEVIDQLTYAEGELVEGEVFARIPDGIGEMQRSTVQTPNERNQASPTSPVEEVVVTEAGAEAGTEAGAEAEIAPQSLPPRLVINEIAAKGDPSDWVELYNGGDLPAPLVGFSITDDLEADPFTFDEAWGEVAPRSFFIVEISDDTVGFKLGSDEALYLLDPQGGLVDSVDWEEGDSPEEMSFARSDDGEGVFQTGTPTPGASN